MMGLYFCLVNVMWLPVTKKKHFQVVMCHEVVNWSYIV